MEFRRARRGGRYAGGTDVMASSLVIGVAILAIVYLVGVSRAGTWVAEHMIAPAFLLFSGKERASTVAAETGASANARKERAVPLDGLQFYALQMGAYTDFDNAIEQAKELQKLGAGGYLYQDGVRYRVLAAGYADADSLASVRSQLLAEGLDNTAFPLETEGRSLLVQTTESEADVIQRAADALPTLLTQSIALAIEFDREKQSAVVGRSALRSLLTETDRLCDSLTGLRALPGVAPLAECYDGIASQMRIVCDNGEQTRTELSAALKYTCIVVAVAIQTLLSG